LKGRNIRWSLALIGAASGEPLWAYARITALGLTLKKMAQTDSLRCLL